MICDFQGYDYAKIASILLPAKGAMVSRVGHHPRAGAGRVLGADAVVAGLPQSPS